jgi:hypothetical protein
MERQLRRWRADPQYRTPGCDVEAELLHLLDDGFGRVQDIGAAVRFGGELSPECVVFQVSDPLGVANKKLIGVVPELDVQLLEESDHRTGSDLVP